MIQNFSKCEDKAKKINFQISLQIIAQMKLKTSVHIEMAIISQNFNIFVTTFWTQTWPNLKKLQNLQKSL